MKLKLKLKLLDGVPVIIRVPAVSVVCGRNSVVSLTLSVRVVVVGVILSLLVIVTLVITTI